MTKYFIIKTTEGISLQQEPFILEEDSTVAFSFEAKDFTTAMSIRNKFLDFEPYVPLSEHIVCFRDLTLFDKNKQPQHEVKVLVYQPVKMKQDQWLCEYHINIEHKNKHGEVINTKNLGGRNIIGYDMVQAIQGAFLVIDSVIYDFNTSGDDKIYWLEYGKDCGFLQEKINWEK
jgi:hypothetical protein